MPLDPIAEVVEQAVAELEASGVADPVWAVAERIASYRERHGLDSGHAQTLRRTLWRVRHRVDVNRGRRSEVVSMTFSMADEILCALGRVELWREDPRLAAVYPTVRLQPEASKMAECPSCGGPMYKSSKTCRSCRWDRGREAA